MTIIVFEPVSMLAASAQQASGPSVPCTCRYKGEDFGVGDSICLKGSDGMRMATCAMVLNNTSWQLSKSPCPYSRLEDMDEPGMTPATPAPGTKAMSVGFKIDNSNQPNS